MRETQHPLLAQSPTKTPYEHISYDDLTTYIVYRLTASDGPNSQTVFEDIVAEAFRLFPKRFSLRGYPQWPDSSVVNKSWLRLRTDRKFIVGSVKDGFKLTQRGLAVAKRVEKQLAQPPVQGGKRLSAELRTRSGRLLRSIERSTSFLSFRDSGSLGDMTEHDMEDVLLAMPNAPSSRLASNFAQFMDAAHLYNRMDIAEFLDALGEQFSDRIRGA